MIGIYRFVNFRDGWLLVVFLVVSTVAAGLLPPILAVLTGRVFNLLANLAERDGNEIVVRPMAIMALGAASLPVVWASIYCWMALGERQGFSVRRKMLDSYLANAFEWYDAREDLAGKFTQLNRSVEELRASSAEASAVLTRSLVTIVALIGTSFHASWSLTLVTLCSAPLIIGCAYFFSRLVQKYADRENEQISKASQLVDWSVNAAQFIRLCGTELREVQKFKICIQKSADSFIRMCLYASLNSGVLRFLTLTMFVQAFWFGSTMIRKGRLTVGDVITCFHSCILLGSTINGALHQLVFWQKGTVAANQISKFLETCQVLPAQQSESGFAPVGRLRGDICFKDVDFTYPSRPQEQVLRGLSLNFAAGKTTFILGKSGSGKSTLANLLLKFYGFQNGSICVDGTDIAYINQEYLIRDITVVEQRCTIFNGTLRDNITIGLDESKRKDEAELVKLVCRISLLERFIHDLDDGLSTVVGSGGLSLSGGQQQKVAIARALIKDPPVLILDEAVSALDALQRSLIIKAIRAHREGKTTIILTHELDQIGPDDYCYIVDQGAYIEQGYGGQLNVDSSTNFYAWKHLHQDEEDETDNSSQFTSVETPTDVKQKVFESVIDFEVETPRADKEVGYFSEDLESYMTSTSYSRSRKNRQRILVSNESEKISSDCLKENRTLVPIRVILKRMFLLKRRRILLVLGVLCSFIAGAANPIFSYTFSYLLNGVAPQENGVGSDSYLLRWSLIVIGMAAADAIFNFAKDFLLGYCSECWIQQLRNEVMQGINMTQLKWFTRETNKASEVSALLLNDLRDARALASDFVSTVSTFMIVSSIGLMWALISGWKLSLVCMSTFPLIIFFSAFYGMLLQKQETQYKTAVADLENLQYEITNGIKTIRRLHLEASFLERYSKLEAKMARIGSLRAISTGLGIAVLETLTMCIQAILFYYALTLVSTGQYTINKMFETLTLLLFTIMTCNTLVNQIPDISRGQRAADFVFRMIRETKCVSSVLDSAPATGQIEELPTVISVQNLNFAYHTSPSTSIFDNLSLELSAGTTVGIVGESGSGKSTLITLLTKLHDAKSGTIQIENKDINDWNTRDLRSQIAVVEQRPTLFAGTIRENLVYGLMRDVLEVEIYDLLKYVGIHDFIKNLPLGLDAPIDQDLLSGGQAQRLCIARALLRRPRILILDECTSALDPESSHIINSIVKEGPPARLTISITHNVDMMKACNELVFLKNGKVAGKGRFETLYMQNKAFQTLVSSHY
ncbi:hypothetical protein HG537_0H04430 [Torulaspora globosa]|uniref:P-loop containing nucleoside triphosphate hydrolase protein n=1 Tax=Torulaspora globosa TaxID=48254 RepID=A0A7H9HZ07_9SACH|nr:hypothetical protein HG537_0H04430 [Torulaspora sp. CBS 2947]